MVSHGNAIEKGVGILVLVIVAIVVMLAIISFAPTVATSTSTVTGSALANAGITSSSLAGVIYGFVNVFWALLVFVVPASLSAAAFYWFGKSR